MKKPPRIIFLRLLMLIGAACFMVQAFISASEKAWSETAVSIAVVCVCLALGFETKLFLKPFPFSAADVKQFNLGSKVAVALGAICFLVGYVLRVNQ